MFFLCWGISSKYCKLHLLAQAGQLEWTVTVGVNVPWLFQDWYGWVWTNLRSVCWSLCPVCGRFALFRIGGSTRWKESCTTLLSSWHTTWLRMSLVSRRRMFVIGKNDSRLTDVIWLLKCPIDLNSDNKVWQNNSVLYWNSHVANEHIMVTLYLLPLCSFQFLRKSLFPTIGKF